MKTKTSIPAFTLLESLVTLMLISIIIALTYSLVSLVEKQLVLLEQDNNEILEYNLFNATLINDINNSTNYTLESNNSSLVLDYYSDAPIIYDMKPDMVLRQTSSSKDTFKIKTVGRQVSKAYENDVGLELRLVLLKDTISTHYVLKKDNAHLINKKLFNEN